jgi:hypothetical protein
LTTLGIFLGEETSRERGFTSTARREELVGAHGVAVTDLRPAGTGEFGDERVDVVSDSEWIEIGTPIRIVASEGYRHVVRRLPAGTSDAGGAAATTAGSATPGSATSGEGERAGGTPSAESDRGHQEGKEAGSPPDSGQR